MKILVAGSHGLIGYAVTNYLAGALRHEHDAVNTGLAPEVAGKSPVR